MCVLDFVACACLPVGVGACVYVWAGGWVGGRVWIYVVRVGVRVCGMFLGRHLFMCVCVRACVCVRVCLGRAIYVNTHV